MFSQRIQDPVSVRRIDFKDKTVGFGIKIFEK